jgi:transposase-like protein
MDYHYHARMTWRGREVLCRRVVEGRLTLCEAAAEHGLSQQSAGKWVRRYRERGVEGVPGPQFAPAPAASAHQPRTGNASGSSSLDRGADRADDRLEPRHHQPHPGAVEAEHGQEVGTGSAHRAL